MSSIQHIEGVYCAACKEDTVFTNGDTDCCTSCGGMVYKTADEFDTPDEFEMWMGDKPVRKWYFTFGVDHEDLQGRNMGNRYVAVEALSYYKARELFCEQFAKPVMGRPEKWAFQYTEKEMENVLDRFPMYLETTIKTTKT